MQRQAPDDSSATLSPGRSLHAVPAPFRARARSIPLGAGTASLLLVLAVLTTGPALASHPFGTDDAGTVGGGAVELELSSLVGGHGGHAHGDVGVELGFGVHVGVLERLDLGLTLAFESLHHPAGWSHGLADPVLDLKARLADPDGAAPGLALRADYKPPQHGEEGHSGHDLVGLVIATWEHAAWAWHVNVGAAWRAGETDEARGTLVGALGLAWAGVDTLALGLELIGEAAPGSGETELETMAALQWEPAAGRIVSLGAGPAWVLGEAPGWHATLGFTAAFGGE